MNNKFSFGIGCFHFGVKKTAPFKFQGLEYIEELGEALQAISNVDNINIDADDRFKNSSIDVTEELPNISSGYGFFPKPTFFMKVQFDVYIPFRIQDALLKSLHKTEVVLETYAEKFKISINYTYFLPVTFVEPINPTQESIPSTAVVVIREFLKEEFKSSTSDYVQFEVLGPSPFHVDCYVKAGETKSDNERDWKFQVKRTPRTGYDDIVFCFNPLILPEDEGAKKALMRELEEELGFFYYMVQMEVEKSDEWEDIQDLVNQLVAIQRTKGIKGFFKKSFVRKTRINETFTSLVAFKTKDLFFQNLIATHYNELYSCEEVPCFRVYLDKAIKDRTNYPTREVSELLDFFETRRLKSIELFVVLVSAILGGSIGALVTIFLTR